MTGEVFVKELRREALSLPISLLEVTVDDSLLGLDEDAKKAKRLLESANALHFLLSFEWKLEYLLSRKDEPNVFYYLPAFLEQECKAVALLSETSSGFGKEFAGYVDYLHKIASIFEGKVAPSFLESVESVSFSGLSRFFFYAGKLKSLAIEGEALFAENRLTARFERYFEEVSRERDFLTGTPLKEEEGEYVALPYLVRAGENCCAIPLSKQSCLFSAIVAERDEFYTKYMRFLHDYNYYKLPEQRMGRLKEEDIDVLVETCDSDAFDTLRALLDDAFVEFERKWDGGKIRSKRDYERFLHLLRKEFRSVGIPVSSKAEERVFVKYATERIIAMTDKYAALEER